MGSTVARPGWDFPREERDGQHVVTRLTVTSDGTPAAVTCKTENTRPIKAVEIETDPAYTIQTSRDAVVFTPPASRAIGVKLYS